jgi:hypothetical protein
MKGDRMEEKRAGREEFVGEDQVTNVRAFESGIAVGDQEAGVIVSLELGQNVELREGDSLTFAMDPNSAGRLAASLGRLAIEAEAWIAAERN